MPTEPEAEDVEALYCEGCGSVCQGEDGVPVTDETEGETIMVCPACQAGRGGDA
jgi:hypothetical protein